MNPDLRRSVQNSSLPTTPTKMNNPDATALNPVATRFAWKEYRMFRGLWLALLALGMLFQWFCGVAMPPQVDWPTLYFSIALATAAVYAVGAAATAFSVEREEDTYGFLAGLPCTWRPLFAGKLAVTVVSAVALAAALALVGWMAAGRQWPTGPEAVQSLKIFGFAIVEAIAWGTLFSLLLQQPLLAALLTIAAQSIALTWATNTFGTGALPSLSLDSYAGVFWVRAAIVLVVALCDVLVARNWLVTRSRRGVPTGLNATELALTTASLESASALGQRIVAATTGWSRRVGVFGHLVWQTWRQSWRLMFAMPVVALFSCFAVSLVTGGITDLDRMDHRQVTFLPFLFCLAATALYASAVFYADQRGERYRFLAEHAAWPRYVWLARLTVWLLPIVVVLTAAVGLLAVIVAGWFDDSRRHMTWLHVGNAYWNALMLAELWDSTVVSLRGLAFALWGLAAGFAVGQACSLFFRRAIIAGFVATAVVVPLAIWGFAVWMWELSPAVFLLPIVAGLFVATWLRAPDWIIDRNHVGGWFKVAAAIGAPLLICLFLLPRARLAPVEAERWTLNNVVPAPVGGWPSGLPRIDVATTVAGWVDDYEASISPAARANGDELLRFAEQISSPPARPTRQEYLDWRQRILTENRASIEQAVVLSRQDVRFPPTLWESETTLDRMTQLIDVLSAAGTLAADRGDLDGALEYHLAALRIWNSVVDSAPWFVGHTPGRTRELAEQLATWAARDGQTTARLARAQREIDAVFPTPQVQTATDLAAWKLPPALVTGYLQLRDVLQGKRLPTTLDDPASQPNYVAYFVNQFAFERERAIMVLDYLLVDQAGDWRAVADQIAASNHPERWESRVEAPAVRWSGGPGPYLQRRIAQGYESSFSRYGVGIGADQSPPNSWIRTSYLLRNELEHGDPFGWFLEWTVNQDVIKWGLKQQLALIAYRLDHGAYPESLDALVPEYLPFVPLDVWAARPFEYRPHGLDRELRLAGGSQNVKPHTPLLWSVGARNAQFVPNTEEEIVNNEDDPTAEGVEVRREIYVLRDEPGPEFYRQYLVFPLPR